MASDNILEYERFSPLTSQIAPKVYTESFETFHEPTLLSHSIALPFSFSVSSSTLPRCEPQNIGICHVPQLPSNIDKLPRISASVHPFLSTECSVSPSLQMILSVSSPDSVVETEANSNTSPFREKVFESFVEPLKCQNTNISNFSTSHYEESPLESSIRSNLNVHHTPSNLDCDSTSKMTNCLRNNCSIGNDIIGGCNNRPDEKALSVNRESFGFDDSPFRKWVFDSFNGTKNALTKKRNLFRTSEVMYNNEFLRDVSADEGDCSNNGLAFYNEGVGPGQVEVNDEKYLPSGMREVFPLNYTSVTWTSKEESKLANCGESKNINAHLDVDDFHCWSGDTKGECGKKNHFIYSKMCRRRCRDAAKEQNNLSTFTSKSNFPFMIAKTDDNIDLEGGENLENDRLTSSPISTNDCKSFVVKFFLGGECDDNEPGNSSTSEENNDLYKHDNDESLNSRRNDSSGKIMPRVLTLIELARNSSAETDLCEGDGLEVNENLRKLAISPSDHEMLCGNRVSQMTRTYHDIEAVTRLLEEKEKDLELAARIGQQLLARNRTLEEKNASLESELSSAAENLTQLRHELLMKSQLLHIYTDDVEDPSSVEASPTGIRSINVDILQRRVKHLESENVHLREEASQLTRDTYDVEEKEKELVHDVIKQLNEANQQVSQLSDDLSKKIEENLRHQEDNTQLLAQIAELQANTKHLSRENDELNCLVIVAQKCQEELSNELALLKEKYCEVLDILHDTQEQLRKAQKRNPPYARASHLSNRQIVFGADTNHGNDDSILSELSSLNCGLTDVNELGFGVNPLGRVFNTVRLSSNRIESPSVGLFTSGSSSVYTTPTKNVSHYSTLVRHGGSSHTFSTVPDRSAEYFGGLRGYSARLPSSEIPSLDSGAESDASFPTDSEDNYPASHAGVPGYPGTPDLNHCLRRLGPLVASEGSGVLPYGCRTPDSIMSTGSMKSGTLGDWKLPQKLQIVKPIEGSQTLHQWSQLATPTLKGLLEEKEGIVIKGAAFSTEFNFCSSSLSDHEAEDIKSAELKSKMEEDAKNSRETTDGGKKGASDEGRETFTKNNVLISKESEVSESKLVKTEADEEEEFRDTEHPGKQFMATSGIYTFTNSTVLHPDDLTNITTCLRPTPVAATESLPSSNSTHSRRGSTATFSTNVALAKHLHERGTSAKSKGELGCPTATPANSPEGSRPESPSHKSFDTSSSMLPSFYDFSKGLYAGASFLKKKFYGSGEQCEQDSPSCPTSAELELGVDNATNYLNQAVGPECRLAAGSRSDCLPLRLSGGIVSSRASTVSPLLHLSSLIRGGNNTGGQIKRPLQSGKNASLKCEGSRVLHPTRPGQRIDLGTVGSARGRTAASGRGTNSDQPSKSDGKIGTVGWMSFGRKGGLL